MGRNPIQSKTRIVHNDAAVDARLPRRSREPIPEGPRFEDLERRELFTADLAGNTLAAARPVTVTATPAVYADYVGADDRNDYYKFSLTSERKLNLSLSNLKADADVQLLNSIGGVIATSAKGGTTSESIVRDLPKGTYYVRVFPYSGNTTYNLILAATAITTVPATPTGVTASDGTYKDKVQVTWNQSAGAASYEVYRSTSSTTNGTRIAYGVGGTVFEDKTAVTSTNYWYRVVAVNGVGKSAFSAANSGYLMKTPTAPTGVTASDGTYTNKVVVAWTASPGATQYDVYRSTTSGGSGQRIASNLQSTTFSDTTAMIGSKYRYYYTVVAKNAAGNSPASAANSGYAQWYLSSYAGAQLDGLQCVPAARNVSMKLNGIGFPYLGANGVAADLWKMTSITGFSKVAYQAGQVPPKNALLIWKPTAANGYAGHIAVVIGTTSSGAIRVVDSNWGKDERGQIHDVVLSSTEIYGWFTPVA